MRFCFSREIRLPVLHDPASVHDAKIPFERDFADLVVKCVETRVRNHQNFVLSSHEGEHEARPHRCTSQEKHPQKDPGMRSEE